MTLSGLVVLNILTLGSLGRSILEENDMIRDKNDWSFYRREIAPIWWRINVAVHRKDRRWANRWRALSDYRIATGQRYSKTSAYAPMFHVKPL